jgi:GTPase SAR1 family protein
MSNQIFELEAVTIRSQFAEQLVEMSQIISRSEQQAVTKGGSGALDIAYLGKGLESEAEKLKSAKFRFLVIGDFNRGKSSVLNALLGQSLLPVGVTATTMIPTFIKYGDKEEIVVHKKSGHTENLSIAEYEKEYTLNSKEVRNAIKSKLKTIATLLKGLDYAEFYCPISILSQGVEFIDTAGLNHTEEENRKTLSYISECHAIIFVLAAKQQFTLQEKEYLETFIGKKKEIESSEEPQFLKTPVSRPIFYLVNKWDEVAESDKEEICDTFTNQFSDALKIKEEEAEGMWGDTIFTVSTQTALPNQTALSNPSGSRLIEGTGLGEFQKRLSDFLLDERLLVELKQAIDYAKYTDSQIRSGVDVRLVMLTDTLKDLEEKSKKVKPLITELEIISQARKKSFEEKRETCLIRLRGEYEAFFGKLARNFKNDFNMPSATGLSDSQREQYTKTLETKLSEYRQEKISVWQAKSESILRTSLTNLEEIFRENAEEYDAVRKKIEEELNPGNLSLQVKQNELNSRFDPDDLSLRSTNADATTKMVLGASGGTVGTLAAGVGGATIANLAGAHIVLGTVGAGLALTPVGWALLGASAVVGGGVAWWQRRGELKKFQDDMLDAVQKEFEKLLDSSSTEKFEKNVMNIFVPFEDSTSRMIEDISSLDGSLQNLLTEKRTGDIEAEKEKPRLEEFSRNISNCLKKLEEKYDDIKKRLIRRGKK